MILGLISHPDTPHYPLSKEELSYIQALLEALAVTDIITTLTPAWETTLAQVANEMDIRITAVLPSTEYADLFDDFTHLQQITQFWSTAHHLHALPFSKYSEAAMRAAQQWVVQNSHSIFSLDLPTQWGLQYAENQQVTIYQPWVLV
ncbi:MAG: hypothetical protein AAFQ98_24970 [Bacteroidota bacterium]